MQETKGDIAGSRAFQQKIRVLLVDDHPLVLEGIRSILAARPQFDVIGQAEDGRAGLALALALQPDVVVLDIAMPVLNGLAAARQLQQEAPAVKVLILSVHETADLAADLVRAGARGFVSKYAPPSEVADAIESIYRGETRFSPRLAGALAEQNTRRRPGKTDLSAREREVVGLIASGLCNKEVASRLGVSVRTVEKHRERTMHKLDLHSVVQLTRYAITHHLTVI
jgi:DNA-binding NarL/FixJ family response regulator